MTGPEWRLLVVAKAPVPGEAKTRLAPAVGHDTAADLAAAALLDTLAAGSAAVGPERCVLALTGDLDAARCGDQIRRALRGWRVVDQRGAAFDARLASAHEDCGPGPVVQIGMDTPQVTPSLLHDVARGLTEHDAVLGAADDGGWWVLALRDPAHAAALRGVAMSSRTTYRDTRAALTSRGLQVGSTARLRDVDELDDADAVAASAPTTRFADRWHRAHLEPVR